MYESYCGVCIANQLLFHVIQGSSLAGSGADKPSIASLLGGKKDTEKTESVADGGIFCVSASIWMFFLRTL